jgi:hypothetical protein
MEVIMTTKSRRPSPLQRCILKTLAAMDEQHPGLVRTRDLEEMLGREGNRTIYGPNLRESCRRLEAAGWLLILRAPNLQLAVKLTEAGRKVATTLLADERETQMTLARACDVQVLPLHRTASALSENNEQNDRLVTLGGVGHMACRSDFVVRNDGSTCLQLWQISGELKRLEGDPLQVASWLQECHDAGLHTRVQVNESHLMDDGIPLSDEEIGIDAQAEIVEIWNHALKKALTEQGLRDLALGNVPIALGNTLRQQSMHERLLTVLSEIIRPDAFRESDGEAFARHSYLSLLPAYGFTTEQAEKFIRVLSWSQLTLSENDRQELAELSTRLEQLANRHLICDQDKLSTLVFLPVRKSGESWHSRLLWLLDGPGARAFNFRSLVPQNAARPALDYLAGWLGESAAEEIARIIQWPVTTSVDANTEGDDG